MEQTINIEVLKELGQYAVDIKKELKTFVKVGVTDRQIIDFIEKKIFEKNYLPAFPSMVVFNSQAAHYTIFDDTRTIEKNDVVNIDFGISKNGWLVDNAITIEMENNKYEKLNKAALESLNKVCEKIHIGMPICEIGKIVEDVAKSYGFNSIHNLSGHQIKQNVLHAGLSIPNYDNNDKAEIEDNMIVAVEPFITEGEPAIKETKDCNILHLQTKKPVRDIVAKRVLNIISQNYKHLPFSKRWLLNDVVKDLNLKHKGFTKAQVTYGVNVLKQQEILKEYGLLETIDDKMVSQFEHTICFSNGKKYILTKDENE